MTQDVVSMLRPNDLARELGLSRVRVYALIRAGVLPTVRVGGAIRIPRAAWDAWLKRRADEALASLHDGTDSAHERTRDR